MSEVIEKKKANLIFKVIGGVWLVVMILSWVLFAVLGSYPILFVIAIIIIIAGPLILGIINYIRKEKKINTL